MSKISLIIFYFIENKLQKIDKKNNINIYKGK